MNSTDLEQLRACCRDQVAFKKMQQILANADSASDDSASELNRSKALLRVITQAQSSPDLGNIFQVAVEAVKQILAADRVSVFRFDPDSSWQQGMFVTEVVSPGFASVLNTYVQNHRFGSWYTMQRQSGKLQVTAELCRTKLQTCHREALARFQVQSSWVVPLRQGDELWGLLCVHQCTSCRDWQPDEIDFVAQIAAQLTMALKQADFVARTQQQAQALAEALKQLKQSQTQLVQTEKLSSLGQLVTGIAHEINNPINFICGNLDHADRYAQQLIDLLMLYQQEHRTPSPKLKQQLQALDLNFIVQDFPKLLSSLRVGGERIRQLVLSLRNFSRVDAPEMQPTNLHDGIDSTLLILQPRLKPSSNSRGIHISCDYSDLPLVECYTNQINQVFMNLISNAIDALESRFSPTASDELSAANLDNTARQPSCHPQITIRTMQIPDPQGGNPRVVICIADNGIGISSAAQAQLFEPFFTTKPIGKGTGLGLSICRDIVVGKHGGDLQYYSEPGVGTEFWIELPVKSLSAPAVAPQHQHRHPDLIAHPQTVLYHNALRYEA